MIRQLQQLSTVALLLLMSDMSYAQAFPLKPFFAEYIVSRNGNDIGIHRSRLKQIGDSHWSYTSKVEATGWLANLFDITVTEESHFQWDDGIRVSTYRYDRSGKEKHVYLNFDWQTMKVTNTINTDPWQMDILPGTQDKISINLALNIHLAQQHSDISFPVADGGKLKIYDFKITGKDYISTPFGHLETIKVERSKRGRNGDQTIIWLAPDHQYLAVQVKKANKHGETLTAVLRTLQL